MEIEKIPENVNLVQLYKEQNDMKSDDNYENYLKYLSRFFKVDDGQSKYDRKISDQEGYQYLLSNRKNEKKNIYIEPSRYVNLFLYEKEALKEMNDILYQISNLVENKENVTDEDRNLFQQLKMNYSILKKHQDEIKTIQSTHFQQLNELYDKKLKQIMELSISAQERINKYEQITTLITIEEKNEIAQLLAKENKSGSKHNKKIYKELSEYQIKELAKKFKIPNQELEAWMKWIISSVLYIQNQIELNKINKEIKTYMENYNLNMEEFMFEPPKILKTKL